MIPEVRVGGGDDGVDEGCGDMLRVLVADGDVAARGVFGGKGCEQVRACAVVDARRLQQQTVGRIEQARQDFGGGQSASDVGVAECAKQNADAEQNRKDDSPAENESARAVFTLLLLIQPAFAAGTEDGKCGRHGGSIKACPEWCNRIEGMKDEL